MLGRRGVIVLSVASAVWMACMSGCVTSQDFHQLESAVIDLQNAQRKTQGQLKDLEARVETQRQALGAEIQKVEKEGDPLKKHLADMYTRLERMETRIQQITGMSDEDRYRFQQLLGGLKELDQSVQRKVYPMEQQIQTLETQVRTLLESYQAVTAQMKAFESSQKSVLARLNREAKPESPNRVKEPAKPLDNKPSAVEEQGHEALYKKAKEKLDSGEYDAARKMFQEYVLKYPKESMAPNAQYWIGESYYNQNKYEEAIIQFDKVVQNYPKSDKVPGAVLKEAMAFCKMGDKDGCRLFLNKVIQDFPKSPEAKKAAQELEKVKQ